MATPIPRLNFKQVKRFWRKVSKAGPDECWLWTGAQREEYGSFEAQGQKIGAHRLAYFLGHGVDPGERLVCHTCDTPLCCNPAHYFLGDSRANVRDMVDKGRNVDNRGERNAGAILTAEQVQEIRLSELPGSELARRYGVHKSAISRIKSGQRWSRLAEPSADPAARAGADDSICTPPAGHPPPADRRP